MEWLRQTRNQLAELWRLRPQGRPGHILILMSFAWAVGVLVVSAICTLPYVPADKQFATAVLTLSLGYLLGMMFHFIVWYVDIYEQLAIHRRQIEDQ